MLAKRRMTTASIRLPLREICIACNVGFSATSPSTPYFGHYDGALPDGMRIGRETPGT